MRTATKKGETMYDRDGKPFMSFNAAWSWNRGAICQLADIVDANRDLAAGRIEALEQEVAALKAARN